MPLHARIDPHAAAERAGVLIRAAEPDDLDGIDRTMGSPGVIFGTGQLPYTPRAYRNKQYVFDDRSNCFLVAVPAEGGESIGNIFMSRIHNPRRMHIASIGMAVHDDWQGRGVGTALMAAVIDLADNWWQVSRLHLDVYTDNEPGLALYRKFGFEIEGTQRRNVFRDGEYVDSHVMGRLRD